MVHQDFTTGLDQKVKIKKNVGIARGDVETRSCLCDNLLTWKGLIMPLSYLITFKWKKKKKKQRKKMKKVNRSVIK